MDKDLESLYQQAKSALRGRDYVRAGELLRQILVVDENFKDASRLLAQTVKLRRRRWYGHPLLWGILGIGIIVALVIWLAPRISVQADLVSTATKSINPTITITSTEMAFPSETPTLIPTVIPLAWKRISLGQEFARDEITTIYQDPSDKDLLLVRTNQAGRYKSINGGASWQPTGEDVPEMENNTSNPDLRLPGKCVFLVIDSTDSRIAYCGIEKGIFWTRDAGKNWQLSNPKVGLVKSLLISPHDSQIVFVGGQGFSISKDGGQTWSQSNNGLPNVPVELKMSPKAPSLLFVQDSTAAGLPVFRSTDNGQTWNHSITNSCALMFDANGNPVCGFYHSLDGGKTWINAPEPIGDFNSAIGSNFPYSSTVILKTHGSPIFLISQDKGGTWHEIDRLDTDDWDLRIRFYFDHQQGQTIYSFAFEGQSTPFLHRSNDYGETWAACSSPAGASSPRTDTRLAIDYQDSGHLLLATRGNGVQVSEDGCNSWQSSNVGLGDYFVNSVAVTPRDPNIVYAGTDGGAYVSFDFGQTWGQINDGLLGATVVYSIVVDKDGNVYAATPYGIFKLEGK